MSCCFSNNDFIINLKNKMKQELMISDIFRLIEEIEEYQTKIKDCHEEIEEYKKKLEEEYQTKIKDCRDEILGEEYFNIGCDFENQKHYVMMKKYYLMAIDKGNSNAMWEFRSLLSIRRKRLHDDEKILFDGY
jgi:hypothetical protein